MKIARILLVGWVGMLMSCSNDKDDLNIKPELPEGHQEEPYRVLLWVDASANYANLSSEEGIKDYVQKAAEIGVTHLVVDVKGASGEVLYNSDIAPMNLDWRGAKRIRDFDYLRIFINEARQHDLKIFAAMNVFAGGNRTLQRGIVYQEPDKADWASSTYEPNGTIRLSTETLHTGEIMLNVSKEDVREYQLLIMEEIATKYPDLDGITLDRCRWDGGLRGDFSNFSRELFEDFIGQRVLNFPKDIFDWVFENGEYRRVYGPYFQKWNEWRCSVIFDFISTAKSRLTASAPDMEFSAYVGAWYGSYYDVGVNWASNRFSPYDNASWRAWSTSSYHRFGYAQLLDLLMTGNYAYAVSLQESAGWSVESMAIRANEVTRGDTKVYAGLYLNDYVRNGVMDVNQMEKAIEMSFKHSRGVMLFDVIYFELYDCWDNAAKGIARGVALKENS